MNGLGAAGLLRLQLTLICYVAIGFLCRKRGILNDLSERNLADAIILLVLPCTIFNAMLEGLAQVDWALAGVTVIAVIIIHFCAYFLGLAIFGRYEAPQRAVCIFGMLVNNAAFIGLPMVSAAFGAEGVFYTTIFMTVSRVFMWTIGLHLFNKDDKRNPVFVVLTNPNTIAMFLALFVYYLLPFELPLFLGSAIRGIAGTSNVLCMVMIGSLLTGLHKGDIFQSKVFIYTTIRLIAFPLAVFFALRILHMDPFLTGVLTLLVSAPGPTTGSVMATKYHGDKRLAATTTMFSTLASIITMPLLSLLFL